MSNEVIINEIKQQINSQLDGTRHVSDEELQSMIEEKVFAHAENYYLSPTQKQKIIKAVFSSYRGLDVLQYLVDDRSITEIMINGPDNIFIERDGVITRSELKFESAKKLEDIIQKIVGSVNRTVNEANPIVDARLIDGSRVNIALPPITLGDPVMTIRKFPEHPMNVNDLMKKGSLSEEAAVFLRLMVRARYNIFVSGGTGSGKTTLLNVLSNFIPEDQRIVTIEDLAELQIKSVPNLVRMEVRNPNTEGKGEVNMRYLIRTSLRMRPDRIVVGESRGPEALDMLQAMNTGHDGSLSTGHANTIPDMLSRLETMVLSAAPLPLEAIRQQIGSAIDLMIHLSRLRDRTRKVMEISELVGLEEGRYALNSLFRYVEEGETAEGKIIGSLQPTGNKLVNTTKLQMAGIDPEKLHTIKNLEDAV